MRFRGRTGFRFVPETPLGTAHGTSTHNISSLRRVLREVLGAEAGSPSTLGLAGLRIAHYITNGFGMRRKEPAPFAVLPDRAGRAPVAGKPGDPFGFLTGRHPHLSRSIALAEHHQHAHRPQFYGAGQ